MTQSKSRAVYSILIWGSTTVVFSLFFFIQGGAATFLESALRRLGTAGSIGIGFIAYYLMLYRTRSNQDVNKLIVDVRDVEIARRANELGLMALLVLFFCACMILFVLYERVGMLPVSWMWYLAYLSICFGFCSQALATLVLNKELSGDA